jgi:hypothetical protein
MTTPRLPEQPAQTPSESTPEALPESTPGITSGARGSATRAGQLVGRPLGGFFLEALIGAGGMAEVYRAREIALDREVAVKVLPAVLAVDPDYVRRFRAEARRVAALEHPHIVPIYHFDDAGPLLYLVMPILKESLRERLSRETRLDPDEAVGLIRQIASALAMAHAQQLVHRDVKPENILLDEAGNALLTDFGIARQVTYARQGGAQTLSGTGLPVGTPEYMAPEQLRNAGVDQRADIYALAAVLYELLTGRAPHEADTPYEVAALVLTAPLAPPAALNPAIWPALNQVILKALAFRPEERYQDADSFAAALEEALAAPRDGARPGATTAAVGVTGSPGRLANGAEGDESDIATVTTLPAITIVRPTIPALALATLRRQRVILGSVAALLALTILGGGTLAKLNGFGFANGVRTIFLPGQVITATPQPTAIATPTRTARPSLTPVPQISVSPLNLVKSQDDEICTGFQYIKNNTTQTLGWHWQQNPPGGLGSNFAWALQGSQSSQSWPPQHAALAGGGTDSVSVSMRCTRTSYDLTLTDSLGRGYTFTMTSQ